jgi:hypothetical protein
MPTLKNAVVPVILFATVLIVFAGGWWIMDQSFPPQSGQLFADKFSAISALFSGLAFAGLIWAVALQRKELELQREELSQTRDELRGQKVQLEAQNSTLKLQNFENSFLNLLAIHNSVVSGLEIDLTTPSAPVRHGRACFDRIFEQLKQIIGRLETIRGADESLSCINDGYLEMFDKRQSEIGHYFRTLYNIVKYVDKSDVPGGKQLYVNLLRAQLSLNELRVIFYNCLSGMGSERFKPLIEKYGFLEQLKPDDLINPDHHVLYESSAYHEQL